MKILNNHFDYLKNVFVQDWVLGWVIFVERIGCGVVVIMVIQLYPSHVCNHASCYTDLEQALSDLKKDTQLSIPLVVFGHMHKELAFRNGFRKMIEVGPDKTIYLNGAIVPRVKHTATGSWTSSRCFDNTETPFCADEAQTTLRAFTLVDMSDGRPADADGKGKKLKRVDYPKARGQLISRKPDQTIQVTLGFTLTSKAVVINDPVILLPGQKCVV
ncbi:hypothetical protein ACLOJK_028425 [Asimina triloba]